MKKWILRLLTTVIVLGGLFLFALNIISGTSDTQKNGLEQAFSQIFKGQAHFGKLVAFNLFPQFLIAIDQLDISSIKGVGTLSADSVAIGFGSIDLLAKNRKIEKFHLKNLQISEGVYTPLPLSLESAEIVRGATEEHGAFRFNGTYGSTPINGQVAMVAESGMQPKYHLDDKNAFTITMGHADITGIFHPYSTDGNQISQIKITLSVPNTTKHHECTLPPEKAFPLVRFITDILGKMDKVSADKTPTEKNLDNLCKTLASS